MIKCSLTKEWLGSTTFDGTNGEKLSMRTDLVKGGEGGRVTLDPSNSGTRPKKSWGVD